MGRKNHLQNKNWVKFLVLNAFFISVALTYSVNTAYGDGFSFHTPVNLTNNGTSTLPALASSGDNVYVVYQVQDPASTFNIFILTSTNNGTTFSTAKNISNLNAVTIGFESPQIAASGSNVYVTWDDDGSTGLPQVFFTNSSDNGSTFGPPENLSNSAGFAEFPKIFIEGTKVFIVYEDDDNPNIIQDIFFTNSSDNGANFGTAIDISNSGGFSDQPEISVSDGKIYVVWKDDVSDPDNDIFFAKSLNSGVSFDDPVNLSNSNNLASTEAKIASKENDVFVVWQESVGGADDILFRSSNNNGTSFNAAINISNNPSASTSPQIAVSGSNIHVVWQDSATGNNEIFYSVSSNNGTSFSSPVNISNTNSGTSTAPMILAVDSNVFIVWQDSSDGDNDVLFRASSNNGTTFSTTVNVSNDATSSTEPKLSKSGSNVHFTWSDATSNVFYVNATQTPSSISFNASQYKLSQTAQLEIDDFTANSNATLAETIQVSVTSTSGSVGITVSLTETGQNTSIFRGVFDFTSGASSGTSLKAKAGDTLTAKSGSLQSTASLFPIIVDILFTTHTLSELPIIEIDNPHANLDPGSQESIVGTVTTTTSPSGISLTFKETGVDTGKFRNSKLVLMTGNDLFQFTDTIVVSQFEDFPDQTTDNTITTLPVDINSTSDPTGLVNFPLTETGPNTGLFEGKFTFTSSSSSGTQLQASLGDVISVTYNLETSNGLLIPNPDPTVGAIQAAIGDTLTASFDGISDTAPINAGAGGGGGGGGLIRPGLVVDVVASLVGGGGSSGGKASQPTFSPPESVVATEFVPVSINDQNFGFDDAGNLSLISDKENMDDSTKSEEDKSSKTVKIEKGKESKIVLRLYSPLGKDHIQHVAFYTNTKEKNPQDIPSNTAIIYDKDKPLQIFNGQEKFSEVNMALEEDGEFVSVTININFAETMDTSDIVLKIWDMNNRPTYTTLEDAIQVIPSQSEQKEELDANTQEAKHNKLPSKNSEEIKTVIKKWGGFSEESAADSELLSEVGVQGSSIPKWFKKTARWIVEGHVDLKDFLDAIDYMSKRNIIS